MGIPGPMERPETPEGAEMRHNQLCPGVHTDKSAQVARAVPHARTLSPIVKGTGIAALIVWALATLSNWGREGAALDTMSRLAMNDFATLYTQAHLNPLGGATERIEKLYIVDVREERAYIDGHIPGAILVPEWEIESRIPGLIPRTMSKVVLYCA